MEKRINLKIIDSLKIENGVLVIKYKEPKEGEYWYVNAGSSFEYVFIKGKGGDITNYLCGIRLHSSCFFRSSYNLNILAREETIKELRLATKEEIELLNNKLKEQGKFFNQETKQIEEIKEEIKVGGFCRFCQSYSCRKR